MAQERVSKTMRICREYLEHIQNSVFEGDITDSNLKELKMKLTDIMDKNTDSIIFFYLWSSNYKKEVLGLDKNNLDNII